MSNLHIELNRLYETRKFSVRLYSFKKITYEECHSQVLTWQIPGKSKKKRIKSKFNIFLQLFQVVV